jgi:preprotein translocase subunit SecG
VFEFLLAVLLFVGVILVIVVLLQSGKGGGLASMGGSGAGTDSLIGGRQAATLLTKATWVSGGLFLFLALVLSVMSSRRTTAGPILRDLQQQAAPEPPRALDMPGTSPGIPGTQPSGTARPPAEAGPGAQPSGGATQPAGGATQPAGGARPTTTTGN